MTSQKHTSRTKRNLLTPKVCEFPGCGYDNIVQRHRIIPGKEGGRYILGNVIALCPNHHAESDLGWHTEEYLTQIVEDRIERWKIEKDDEFLQRLRDAEAARSYFASKPPKSGGNGNGNDANGKSAGVAKK